MVVEDRDEGLLTCLAPEPAASWRRQLIQGAAGKPRPPASESQEEFVNILETERLLLRELTADDAAFILELLNEPSFIRYIGDKGVKCINDARQYILTGPIESYIQNGYGLLLVKLKKLSEPIGICGLVKRPALPDPDIGFAFLPAYWSKGYAYEAAVAVLEYGRKNLGLNRVLGITTPENDSSIKVLRKIGLRYDRMVRLSAEDKELMLFTTDA